MKKTFLILSLCIQMLVAGTALAYPVDFTGVTAGTDITGIPYSIGDVTFTYDDFSSGADLASIGPAGISGSSYGSLLLDFAVPMTSLLFNYSLTGVYESDLSAGAVFLTAKGSGLDQDLISLATFMPLGTDSVLGNYGNASGKLAFFGSPFDQVELIFAYSPDFLTTFTADTFDVTPVPEPSTVVLLATGLFGLVFCGKRRMKKAV